MGRLRRPLVAINHEGGPIMKRLVRGGLIALALLVAGVTLAPAVTHADQNPAQTLVGQQTTACKADLRFRFAVISADWTTTIVDRTAPDGAMWAVAVTDVTNLGQ